MFHDVRVAALARPNLYWMDGDEGFQVHAAFSLYDWDIQDDYVANHTAPAA
jgi:hypothetical protein